MSRLVELLSNYFGTDFPISSCENLAEYLEARDVIKPPVEIGDTLWYIEGGYYNASYMRPRELEVVEITKKKTKSGKITDWGFIAGCTRYSFNSIGKTIFWTKKECEAAIENKKKSLNKFT